MLPTTTKQFPIIALIASIRRIRNPTICFDFDLNYRKYKCISMKTDGEM